MSNFAKCYELIVNNKTALGGISQGFFVSIRGENLLPEGESRPQAGRGISAAAAVEQFRGARCHYSVKDKLPRGAAPKVK